MESETLVCGKCKTVATIPKKAFEVFRKAEVKCVKCKETVKRETSREELGHPNDPRQDLKADSELWLALLCRLWDLNKEIYYIFHGLRIAGSHLSSKDSKIEFKFADEYNADMIANIRTKYLVKHKDLIQGVMSRLARDTANHTSLQDCPY